MAKRKKSKKRKRSSYEFSIWKDTPPRVRPDSTNKAAYRDKGKLLITV